MKKILPVAVLAALAGVNAAQAVHVNGDGTGQVLVYPFYSVEGGMDTYIQLVNTTDDFKAVKVRILESMNSQEVLDFNLYLSPQDHWSAVITTDAGGGAAITSYDNSCTVPNGISNHVKVPFRTFQFTGDSVNGIERTREGYVEVIEMGTVVGSSYTAAILHNQPSGVPANCASLDAAWASGGSWDVSDGTAGMSVVTGGLYGYGVLINVPRGTDASFDAVAIDDWIDDEFGDGYFHTGPGNLLPSIVSEADLDYDVFDEGGVVSGRAFEERDAVSVTMMQASIANDYVLEPTIHGGTDWVVNFPTKRFYVNPPGVEDTEPFTRSWSPTTSSACEPFIIEYWNREEGTPLEPVNPNDFSPLPPDPEVTPSSFCYEVNVLTFNDSDVLDASARTGVNLDLEDGFVNGWARIDFTGEGRQIFTEDDVFSGLPVLGFAVQQYVNGQIPSVNPLESGESVLSNYQGTDLHKGDRLISSAD